MYFIYTHNNAQARFKHGLKANTEISFWILNALQNAFPRVCFLRLKGEKERRIRSIRPCDVVIGHLGETWERASKRTRNIGVFGPWCGHEDRSTSISPHSCPQEIEEKVFKRARTVILLTSEFNKRTYIERASNHWFDFFKKLQARMRIVHQPLDFSLYPRIKFNYRTSNFLYIGHFGHMKGVEQAKYLTEAFKRSFHIYGAENKRFNHLNPDQVASLPSLADFFIQPGMWEGQCTSILEAAARGFIPIVTPETGYPYEHPYLLRYGDDAYNVERLGALLSLPEKERQVLGNWLYEQLINDPKHNSWRQLTDVIVEEVKYLYSLKS